MKNYIPQNKHDMMAVENLQRLSFEEIKPDIPELLEWLQDMNWPVASAVADCITPYFDRITQELIVILTSNDDMWKYWIINEMRHRSIKPAPELLPIIKRIADEPDKYEAESEVDVVAKELLEKFDK